MTIAQSMLQEFEQELGTTRKFLERVPANKLNWRPHEKSMTAGQLALHIAQSPAGVLRLAQADEGAPPDFGTREQPDSVRQVLDELERGAAYVRQNLRKMDDARMGATWKLVQGGRTIMAMPRVAFLRSILLNHWYHHRGQLGVYLRLMGCAVPASYGPSGDEAPSFSAADV
jgi:uncharacterized damage-inducible protein DinB